MKTVSVTDENVFLDQINTEVPQLILDRFVTLVRESGSEDERTAADFLTNFLDEWDVQYQVHRPELYLSVPKKAKLTVKTGSIYKEYRVKTPSFSVITGEQSVSGELVYIPTGYAKDVNDIFGTSIEEGLGDFTDKVILTEGFTMPGKVQELAELGAKAVIFISPGENIHEGICTPIWGAPDLDNQDQEPTIAVLAINKSDGNELINHLKNGVTTVEYETYLEKGWMTCPVIDVFIEGTEEPEKYVLLHGHLDSWHEGIGDNATGNAALLEMIRVFKKNNSKLKRSIRVAIWTGHSTGRYGGSTWFADQFGLDLEKNCVAQVNCDSPGCRWATSYDYMMWTSEVDDFCKTSIQDAIGQESKGSRPMRAGDYSFNNIGITSFFMLSSSIPESLLQEKGYYPVGGCGANIEWHTEEDLMHVADLNILEKDMKVYMMSVLRVLNASILPYNFVNTAKEFQETIHAYQEQAGEHFDFTPLRKEVEKLEEDLQLFYKEIQTLNHLAITDPKVRKANKIQQKLARILIPINYTRKGKFRHDPALNVPPLPDISGASDFNSVEAGSHEYKVLQTHLKRGQNRVAWSFSEARDLLF